MDAQGSAASSTLSEGCLWGPSSEVGRTAVPGCWHPVPWVVQDQYMSPILHSSPGRPAAAFSGCGLYILLNANPSSLRYSETANIVSTPNQKASAAPLGRCPRAEEPEASLLGSGFSLAEPGGPAGGPCEWVGRRRGRGHLGTVPEPGDTDGPQSFWHAQ